MKPILSLLPLVVLSHAMAAEPVVKLAGLQIVFDDGADEFDGFKTLNAEKGLGVTLMVTGVDRNIVGFDNEKAELKVGGSPAECRFFSPNMAISKDQHALRVQFTTEKGGKVSADGTLKITGELPLLLASGKEETRSEPFSVAKGAPVKFPASAKEGQPKLQVKSTGKPKWGDNPFEIVFSTDRKADDFAGIRFYDKDGKEVESDRASSSWMGFNNRVSGEITYTFKEKPTDLILAVESWTGREEKKIKVDLSAGLVVPE